MVSNKYVRYIKRRLYKLKSKYKDIKTVEVFIKTIGKQSTLYNVHVNLHAQDNTIFVSSADKDLEKIIELLPNKLQYTLTKRVRA